MTDQIVSWRRRVAAMLNDHHRALSNLEDERVRHAKAVERQEASREAQAVIQTVALAVQEEAHGQIARVVSRCLSAVFEEPYTFRVLFERKRGKTEARLVFERGGREFDPVDAAGGGVLDVAAFALRLAALLLSIPPKRRLLVLDEPFRCVSAEYHDRLRELLEKLSEELDLQIVMVTHNQDLVCGKVYRLGK